MAGRIDFGELVECVRQGASDNLVLGTIGLGQHSLDVPLVLEAVRADYQKVAALGRLPMLSLMDLDELRTAVGGVYHQDVIEHEIAGPDPVVIVERLAWVQDHALWYAGVAVAPPAVVLYGGNLYRCLQAHTTQSDWPPDATPALWTRYYTPGEIPAWVAPVGAQDAWPLDAQVTHNGHLWTSLIRDNVWEPGSVGAEALWRCEDCAPATDAWAVGVAYTGDNTAGAGNGDVVAYNERLYRCLQTHTSIATWTPPAVPALWLDIGPVD